MSTEADNASTTSLTGKGESLLLVEDSPSQAAFYRDALEEAGYAVKVCTTGEEGLESLRAERPSLVLLDMQLPGLDGLHVCAAIRDDPVTHDLPVIILSSRTEVPSVIAGLSIGADDYVGKSEDTRTLQARIRRLLDRTRDYRRLSARERLELLKKASSTLAHGIKNPLQVAFLSLEMLEGAVPGDQDFEDALQYLEGYLKRIVRLVQNIEDVTRVASDGFVERQQLLDVEKALKEAEILARAAGDKQDAQTGSGRTT